MGRLAGGGWAIAASIVLHAGVLWALASAMHPHPAPEPRSVPVVLRSLPRVAAPRPRPARPQPPRAPAPRLAKPAPAPRDALTARAQAATASLPVTSPQGPAAAAVPGSAGATTSAPITEHAAEPMAAVAAQEADPASQEAYLSAILAMIEAQVEYPLQARRMQWAGKSLIHCTLARDGAVRALDIERTSGYRLLDTAAMRAVERAGRFPPVPEAIAGETVTLRIPVTFRLEQ